MARGLWVGCVGMLRMAVVVSEVISCVVRPRGVMRVAVVILKVGVIVGTHRMLFSFVALRI
eukprot:CAMPEP_0175115850 /NCGR_PEP_ID=MMETSP0086_2-20121207/17843_1 /TAXON_ID=136419 /ORGANISM="Unknown Unknown, Strain D1" /LENGTH=60 /DNA_ID=CAMNT_0016396061 /DNA_START=65 /DNA_END=247 /DNA_ORIENTATION=+